VVADIDGDLYPEIIVPNGGSHYTRKSTGLYVLGHKDEPWLGGPTQWNQHPQDGQSPWGAPAPSDRFRSADLNPPTSGAAGNVVVDAALCELDCDAQTLTVAFTLGNAGANALRAGLPYTLYGVDGEELTTIHTGYTSAVLGVGETTGIIELQISAAEVGPDGILLRGDDAAGVPFVRECDETDNEVRIPEATCSEVN